MSVRDKFLRDKSFAAVSILPDFLAEDAAAQNEIDLARQTANLCVLLRNALRAPG